MLRDSQYARAQAAGVCGVVHGRFGLTRLYAPASCGGVRSQVRVAITDGVGAAAHRGSFGDPRARPAAAGFARRHSPSVHWWHSWRGRPLRRGQRLQATWLVAQPVVRSVVSTAAGGGGAVAVRAVGSRGESGPGRGTLSVWRQRWREQRARAGRSPCTIAAGMVGSAAGGSEGGAEADLTWQAGSAARGAVGSE
jgi:hypothetical protein